MTGKMQSTLDCEVCMEHFDTLRHRPKLLTCGHTICLACAKGMPRNASQETNAFLCPMDRKETRSAPEDLNDNFYILSLVDDSKNTQAKSVPKARFWCLECEGVADNVCELKHTICRLQKHRSRELQDTVDLLERSVTTQRRLIGMLRDVEPIAQNTIKTQIEEFCEALETNQASLKMLYESLELVGTEWDEASTLIHDAHKRCAESLPKDEDSVSFLRSAARCEITVHGTNGCIWRGEVNLEGSTPDTSVAFALVTTLERAQVLQVVETPREKDVEMLPTPEAPPRPTPRKTTTPMVQLDDSEDTTASTRPQCISKAEEHVELQEPEKQFQWNGSVLNVWNLSRIPRGQGQTEKDDLLRSVDFHGKEVSVVGLHCDSDPAWACALLSVLGPAIGFLEMFEIGQEHLCSVAVMGRLHTLVISSKKSIAAELPYSGMRRPPLLQKLELNVPYDDVVPILTQCGDITQLDLRMPDNEPRLHNLIDRLSTLHRQKMVVYNWARSEAQLWKLRVVTLVRSNNPAGSGRGHGEKCKQQLDAIVAGLPGVTAACSLCKKTSNSWLSALEMGTDVLAGALKSIAIAANTGRRRAGQQI